jgi:hypothetical protein
LPGAARYRVTEQSRNIFRRGVHIMAHLGHGRFEPAVPQHPDSKIVDLGEPIDGGGINLHVCSLHNLPSYRNSPRPPSDDHAKQERVWAEGCDRDEILEIINGELVAADVHIRSFQLSRRSLSAWWIIASPLARISADSAATILAIARALPSSLVRALRSPPDRGVG